MPAHIFTRTGDWEKSIDLNRRSAEAALKHSDDIIQTHYVHAIDYIVYGYLQTGQPEKAAEVVDQMLAMKNHQLRRSLRPCCIAGQAASGTGKVGRGRRAFARNAFRHPMEKIPADRDHALVRHRIGGRSKR